MRSIWGQASLIILSLAWLSIAHADPGFYRLTPEWATPALQKASDSVFEIQILSVQDYLFVDLKQNRASFEEKIKAANLKPTLEKIIRYQMDFCLSNGHSQSCKIFTTTSQGSAFLLGDGKTLWTNYHVIESSMTSEDPDAQPPAWLAKGHSGNKNLPLFIFNQQGDLIFVSDRTAGSVRMTGQPFSSHRSFASEIATASSDFIQIRLPKALGKPLMAASGPLSIGQKIYLLSYPVGTGLFKSADAVPQQAMDLQTRRAQFDSNGIGMRMSFGKIIPLDPDILNSPQNSNLNGLFFSDADTVFGSSGGPLLNENGEVVGINSGGGTISEPGMVLKILERGIAISAILKESL